MEQGRHQAINDRRSCVEIGFSRRASRTSRFLECPSATRLSSRLTMAAKFKEQALLFERIPLIEDVQVGWLLLVFCAPTRNSTIRVCYILQMDGLPPQTHEAASMFLTMGGLASPAPSKSTQVVRRAGTASWTSVLKLILGPICRVGHNRGRMIWKMLSQVRRNRDGNVELRRHWRIVSSVVGRVSPSTQGPCFAPKVPMAGLPFFCAPTAPFKI